MPLYEYNCRKCSKRFEQLLYGKEKPSCPSCHGTDLEKLVSTFAAIGGGASDSDSFGGSDFGGGADDGGEFGGDGDSDGESMDAGACGSCGDPRGPGSCAIN